MSDLKPLVLNPPLNVTYVTDGAGLCKVKSFLDQNRVIGWDKETTPTKDFFWRKCRTIQVGNPKEQYVIDLLAFCDGNSDILSDCQGHYGKNLVIAPGVQKVWETLEPSLCSGDTLKVGVHLGFEYIVSRWNFGRRPWNFYSCDNVEKVIGAGLYPLKQYAFFSLEEMMARYFGVQIDKSLQESFNITDPLSQAQIDYAALDTRLPFSIKALQNVIISGTKLKDLQVKNPALFKQMSHLNPLIFDDDLREIAQIENNAIGAFVDMHLHGDNIDKERWTTRIEKRKEELKAALAKMDAYFIQYVGSKNAVISDEDIEAAELTWKAMNRVSDAEIRLKAAIRLERNNPEAALALEAKRAAIEADRIDEKNRLKGIHAELKRKRTAINKLRDKCEGEALINYNSGAQLMNILRGSEKDLKNLADTEDDTLDKYSYIPIMAALREYRGISKEINTYGMTWTQQWITKPCSDEGWLHPGDGKLHCEFNQQEAETGRSSSSKPNAQNLPQDEEVRSSFVADPPNESIRISCCCDAETTNPTGGTFYCDGCGTACDTKPEEYVIVTADMSGAELRIIAELADDDIWIGAFARGEDVHSVGTEIMYAELWPTLTVKSVLKPDGWTLADCKSEKVPLTNPNGTPILDKDGKQKIGSPCAYFAKKENGEPARQKCKCPGHNTYRNDNKSTNFLLAYGGGPTTLAARIKKKLDEAKEIMALHAQKFPKIWLYLENSGKKAKMMKKAFDMFNRRRLFPTPTWERATYKAKDDREKQLRFTDAIVEKNIADYIALKGDKPKGKLKEIDSEYWNLTHRKPTDKEIANAFKAMHGSIERQGKNHCIQGTNATIAKLAMGCGSCKGGKQFLWHTFEQYKARLIKFVHDELVVQCPKRFAKDVAALIGDAFKRAAAEKMKKVVMEFDFNIATYWKK